MALLCANTATPSVFGIAKHDGDKLRLGVVSSWSAGGDCLASRRTGVYLLHELERVGSGDEGDDQHQDDHPDAAATNHRATAHSPAVFDIAAASS